MVDLNYPRGLAKVGTHTYAWMVPDGSWGFSNAGLVVGEGESLLFDTLYDLNLTQEMLDGIVEVTANAPVKRLVNSHGNGDHFYGNQLLPAEVEVITTVGTYEMMRDDTTGGIAALRLDQGPAGRFVRKFFDAFDFDPVVTRLADTTFEGEKEFNIGGVEAVVRDLGPAHTGSDSILWVPEDRVVYAADLLFVGGTPIAWNGPIENWITALDRILELDARVVVPGHGPLSTNEDVKHMQGYLEYVLEGAKKAHEAGIPAVEAAHQFDLGPYAELHEFGRVVQNFLNVYAHRGEPTNLTVPEIIREIAILEGFGD